MSYVGVVLALCAAIIIIIILFSFNIVISDIFFYQHCIIDNMIGILIITIVMTMLTSTILICSHCRLISEFLSSLNFQTSWWQEFLDEPNVWAAFGCHPHYTHFFGEEEEEHLRLALLNPKVVALGEIGLDYSGR